MAELVRDKATGLVATANQVTAENINTIAAWVGGAAVVRTDEPDKYPEGRPTVEVFTGQGIKVADVGDWVLVIESANGTFRLVLSDEDFYDRYEPVPTTEG